jgi:hypothetical protein
MTEPSVMDRLKAWLDGINPGMSEEYLAPDAAVNMTIGR